jgi:uncharacterized protein YabE (DUF348 family)
MRLKNKSYKHLYAINLCLLSVAFLLFLGTNSHPTFADNDASSTMLGDAHYVTIHDNGESLTIKTDALTVADALERAHITLDSTDKIEPTTSERINADNYHINIYRSRPVIVTDGTTKKSLMSPSYDAKEIAASAGFTVYDGDKIELLPASSDFLETGAASIYQITRNGGQTITVESTIPFSEKTQKDPSMELGQTKLTQVGEDGLKVTKYQVNFVDGVEVSRELISEEVTREPVDRITLEGSKQAVPPQWETCADYARQAGVSEADLYIALTIIYRESGCRYTASNSSTGAYGIPQALPGEKMASAGSDWQTNPVTQIRWMISYVNGRYGGWAGAQAWWDAHHWY